MKPKTPDFQKNSDKTFTLTFTLTQEELASDRQRVLKEVQTQFESKGFRKGKAPLDVVESNVSPNQIIEEVLSHLLSHKYQDKLTELNLKPIIDPQINILNPPLDWNKDWQIEVKSCELPELKLSPKYKNDVKKVNQNPKDENDRMNQTIEVILKHSSVNLPEMLIDADLQKHLSQLVDQVQSTGLTVDQYLKSKNENIKDYTAKIKKQITQEWQLNLSISQIAVNEKLEVTKEEVDAVVQKQPDLKQNINMVYYLLTQQKVFDFLKKL